jgi:hypothetical protein
MDINNVLSQLRGERDRIDQAITAVEQLAQGRKRGPGRPPGSSTVSRQVRESGSGSNGRAAMQPDAKQATQ